MMNSLKTIPILGKHALGHAIIHKEKSLENLHFKRLYLVVRQEMPWKATLVMDLTINITTKSQDTTEDFGSYLQSKEALSQIILTNKNLFTHLYPRWISELGSQPDRLRVIYNKDKDYMEYNVKLSLFEKDKIMIQVK
jgi:hypothetical protein